MCRWAGGFRAVASGARSWRTSFPSAPVRLHPDGPSPGRRGAAARGQAPDDGRPRGDLGGPPAAIREVDDQVGVMPSQELGLQWGAEIGPTPAPERAQLAVGVFPLDGGVAFD